MRHRVWVGVRETLLTAAAIGGVVCIALVICAQVFQLTLIMFKTGSMAPTIPAGSVALVRALPASEVRVGDVLTVDREGQLPVTHRVTSVTAGPSPEFRTITMQGDANETPDPAPYVIEQGRVVLGSVPELAKLIVWFGHPLVLGGITISAAILVTWAFWPREPKTAGPEQPRATQRGRHSAGFATLVFLAVSAGVLWGALPASPARADAPPPRWQGEEALRVLSQADLSSLRTLSPGESAHWDLAVDTARAPTGTLSLALAAEGESSLGLMLEVTSCSVRWQGDTCLGVQHTHWEISPARVDGTFHPVAQSPTGDMLWVRVTGSLLPGESPAPGATVELSMQITGEETQLVVQPGGTLAATGAVAPGLRAGELLAFGAVALLGGAGLAATARTREPR